MSNSNQKGIILIGPLDHDGMTLPDGAEVDFGNDELEAALVASGAARWAKGPVPEAATREQLLTAIEAAGLKASLDQVFANNAAMKQMFSLARDTRRSSQVIAALAAEAGKSEAELDDLFRNAAGV